MNEGDGPFEFSIRERFDCRADRQSLPEKRQILLVDLSLDPHGREVGHVVQKRAFLDVFAFDLVLPDDMAADGRTNGQVGIRFPVVMIWLICSSSMPQRVNRSRAMR